MPGISTHELTQKLKDLSTFQTIIDENSSDFIAQPLSEALADLLKKKGITRSQAIKKSMINTIYGQQIFAGSKTPSRDKLLLLAFGMNLTFEETDILLKQQGYPRLYAKRQRDAIIIYGLMHKTSLMDINTLLFENELETLI